MFRVVYSESDFLPGLIVDKYGEYLSLQTYSFGMDKRLTLICDVLESTFNTKGIVERNESPLRALDGLPEKKGTLRGSVQPFVVSEHDVRYEIDLLEGQKTGFYLDQRENRKAIRRYAMSAKVLDCFCNDGGFGLNAAAAGVTKVFGIDASEPAISRAQKNAKLNKLDKVCEFGAGDVFEITKEFVENQEKFDVVILDPPSFTKSKKNIPMARKGYKEVNTNAIRLLNDGGILATGSCSHHLIDEMFLDLVGQAAAAAGRRIQLVEWRGAAFDHPVLPAMPETKYLKFGIFILQ